MNEIKNKDVLVIGLALFAMFFGAGNLIFPPAIGIEAGSGWMLAMLGFFVTGIGMPLLGIIAVSKVGGSMKKFGRNVGEKFAVFFGVVIVSILGPLMGIPRTGATTFEMGIRPMFGEINPILVSVIFFGITLAMVIKPNTIIDKIGKILTPVLLALLSIIIYKGITAPIGVPTGGMTSPFSSGFTGGYQTMDLFVSIMLGGIVISTLVKKGYTNEEVQRKVTKRAALIAAVGLATVYGGLLYLGATASGVISGDIEKTALTVEIVRNILGEAGIIILGACVSCACLTTSIGITAAVGDFFSFVTDGKLSYKSVVIFTCVASCLISNIGVDSIVKLAGPALTVMYPIAIVLVVLNILDKKITIKNTYKGAVYFTLMVSLVEGILELGVNIPYITSLVKSLPLYEAGFAWLLPAVLGYALFDIMGRNKKMGGNKRKRKLAFTR